MRNRLYSIVAMALFMLSGMLAFSSPANAGVNVTFVDGNSTACPSGFVCLFSVNQTNNSHVGDCNYFNRSVCGNFTSSTVRTGSCNAAEAGVLSLFQRNDTHVGAFGVSNYNNQICVGGSWTTAVRSSCNADEDNMFSLNATNNSHIGMPGYFGNQICIKEGGPIITTQEPQNTTYTTSVLWANVTLNKPGHTVLRSLNKTANVTLTNSSGNWNNQFNMTVNGTHNITFFANDSAGRESTPATVFFTVTLSTVKNIFVEAGNFLLQLTTPVAAGQTVTLFPNGTSDGGTTTGTMPLLSRKSSVDLKLGSTENNFNFTIRFWEFKEKAA